MPNEVWTEKRYRPSMDTIRRANIIQNSLNKLSSKFSNLRACVNKLE